MKRPVQILMLCAFIFLSNASIYGQAFFKSSSSKDVLEQKVAFFGNGDILIANSSTAFLHSGDELGEILLVRIDFCGNVVWSKSYNYTDGYLVLKDVAINADDDIFMYGSHFKGLTESIFLAKLEAPYDGRVEFRIYNPGTVDHFTFSLDIRNKQLVVYGLLFDFNSSKEGFVAYFDSNLNQEGGFKFTPFESTGAAIIADDGGIVARSGPNLYKFDSQGALEWGYSLQEQQEVQNISGPYKGSAGWIYEAHIEDESFLYSIANNGSLAWVSSLFYASNIGGAISSHDQNNLLYSYNIDNGNGTELQSVLISATGEVMQESAIQHEYSINTGQIDQTISDGHVVLIGSNNLMRQGNYDIDNFILKYPIADLNTDCFTNITNVNSRENDLNISLMSLQVETETFELGLLQSSKLSESDLDYRSIDLCSESNLVVPTREEKLLPCAEDWLVNLPSEEYRWIDGFADNERSLSQPGLYTARKLDCLDQEVFEFLLEKEECGCNIYLPNSFSPNSDGMNDLLELGSLCELSDFEISIFNQWGEQVYNSESNLESWSGTFNERDAPSGIYAAVVNYSWTDNEGNITKDKIVQSITLVR